MADTTTNVGVRSLEQISGSKRNKYDHGMFKGLKQARNGMDYALMRGVTDFGNAAQWNPYETGFAFLVVISVPTFLKKLADADEYYARLLQNYVYILENEFKDLSGIDNITSDTLSIEDNISTLNMIGKVTKQSGSTVTMTFTEKSGAPITKLHKLFLTALRDPATQIKTYKGILNDYTEEAGFEKESFTLLYIVADNTVREVESSYLLLNCQPTTAETDIYNYTKGDVSIKEVNVEMNCYPVDGPLVYEQAAKVLDWLNASDNVYNRIIKSSDDFRYTGIGGGSIDNSSNQNLTNYLGNAKQGTDVLGGAMKTSTPIA